MLTHIGCASVIEAVWCLLDEQAQVNFLNYTCHHYPVITLYCIPGIKCYSGYSELS